MELDVAGLGAFVDTTGSRKPPKSKKKSKKEKASRKESTEEVISDQGEILYDRHAPTLHKDEVEERLESLVFGTQPIARTVDSESDQTDEGCSNEEIRDKVPCM